MGVTAKLPVTSEFFANVILHVAAFSVWVPLPALPAEIGDPLGVAETVIDVGVAPEST